MTFVYESSQQRKPEEDMKILFTDWCVSQLANHLCPIVTPNEATISS